jgi:hypothetical protein
LGLSWAAALVAGVLLVVWRRGGRRRHPMTAAAVSGVLVIGYAVFRVVDIGMQVNEHRQSRFDTRVGDAVAAASLAVVAPVVLALLAFALAAALAGHGRRLAAVGAALLAVAALPHVDAALGAVPELFGASRHTALFAVYAVAPSVAMPQPVPALTAAVELAAYLLLIAGLTRPRPMPAPAVKTSTTR